MVAVVSPQRGKPHGPARLRNYGATVLLLVCSASLSRAGEIYKTVDANGNVTYSDHADPSSAQTTVVELQDPRYPPHEMHFCWTNCFTLIYDGHLYRRADGTDETWSVEKFSADSFLLHRHSAPAQWNGFNTDVTYAGHLANDRLVGVTVNGTPTSGIDASWGIALNTLPGSNAERDAAPHDATPTASVAEPPPALIDEVQPETDQDGTLWTPGYWQWNGTAYVWASGAWVRPPAVGLLWTPGYWAFTNGRYGFHPGYWGPHVGFYGGVNYGFGYFGTGYVGGHWVGNAFAYNRAVNHLNPRAIGNTYVETIPDHAGRSLVSYSGGPGGTTAIPTDSEKLAKAEARLASSHARAAVGSPLPPNEVKRQAMSTEKESMQATTNAPVAEPHQASQNQPGRPAIPRSTPLPASKVVRPTATQGAHQP